MIKQFELWDIEQEQKQKQYELAREQRYKNIMERIKTQDFCIQVMKKRHESDLEATKVIFFQINKNIFVLKMMIMFSHTENGSCKKE